MSARADDALQVPQPGPRGVAAGPPGGPLPDGALPAGAPQRERRAWTAPVGLGALTVAATTLLAARSPHTTGSYGSCPFLALTGLWCPACGGLRAVHELTHLDLVGAWSMNPLLVLGVPVLVLAWAWWLARGLGVLPSRPGAARTWPAWTFLVVTVGFTVARNVPALEPWLAPA